MMLVPLMLGGLFVAMVAAMAVSRWRAESRVARLPCPACGVPPGRRALRAAIKAERSRWAAVRAGFARDGVIPNFGSPPTPVTCPSCGAALQTSFFDVVPALQLARNGTPPTTGTR